MKLMEFVAKHPIISLLIIGKGTKAACDIVGKVVTGVTNSVSIIRTGKDPRVSYTMEYADGRIESEIGTSHNLKTANTFSDEAAEKIADAIVKLIHPEKKTDYDVLKEKLSETDDHDFVGWRDPMNVYVAENGSFWQFEGSGDLEWAEIRADSIKACATAQGFVTMHDIYEKACLIYFDSDLTDPTFTNYGWTKEEVEALTVVFEDGTYKIRIPGAPHGIIKEENDEV